jgi:hypothetical protein
MTFSNHRGGQVLGDLASTELQNALAGLLVLGLGAQLLPFPRLFFQLLGARVVALFGCPRLLIHVMVMAPGVRGGAATDQNGNQEAADGKSSHA